MKKAYLVLENGKVFEGTSIGAEGAAMGEIVFTTGVVGYMETLTDAANAGKIVVQTFPLIGNYGVMEEDAEGPCLLGGYVVRELCDAPSNFRSEYALDAFLKKQGVIGISGVDTREITRILQKEGTMRAVISDSVPADFAAFLKAEKPLVAGCTEKMILPPQGEKKYAVTVLDLGVRKSFIKTLLEKGCEVTLLPRAALSHTLDFGDALFVSDGPGNAEDYTEVIKEISASIGTVPLFGIGLGHRIIALSMGGCVYKMPHAHRGGNLPAKSGARSYMTTQNHAYAVDAESLLDVAEETFKNVHDGTNEGLTYPGKACQSLEFYPDIYETGFILDAWLSKIGGKENA